jgi:hypothetical protein
MARDGLSLAEGYIIEEPRRAYLQKIAEHAPDHALPLAITGITGLFADIVSASAGAGQLIEVINQQLAATGIELVRKQRH